MPSCDAACKDAAAFIRNGGLKEADGSSQVEPESYAWLAKINELGMLTFDSQDGQRDERAYVCGFMKTRRALDMVHALNTASDKVFVMIQPCSKRSESRIPLTRYKGKGVTNLHLYDAEHVHAFLRKDAGLTQNRGICTVEAFDPTWERKAYIDGGLWQDVVRALRKTQLLAG